MSTNPNQGETEATIIRWLAIALLVICALKILIAEAAGLYHVYEATWAADEEKR